MNSKKFNMWSNISAVVVVLLSIMIGAYVLIGNGNAVMYVIAIISLVGGPLCLIGYIIEVRKGIFKDSGDD